MATIKGKWVFKDDNSIGTPITISSISFNSNNTHYNSINFNYGGDFGGIMGYYGSTLVYDQLDRLWYNEAYRTIDFGTTEQTVSDTFLSWMQGNATPEAEPEPTNTVTVEYNNTTIASIIEGESVTLNCAGHKMKSGITVTVPEIVVNTVEEWDGAFVLEEYSPVSLISFSIGSNEYQAVEGMTWGEWVESKYNIHGYKDSGYNSIYTSDGHGFVVNNAYVSVSLQNVIVPGEAYTISTGGSN